MCVSSSLNQLVTEKGPGQGTIDAFVCLAVEESVVPVHMCLWGCDAGLPPNRLVFCFMTKNKSLFLNSLVFSLV